MGAAAEQTLFFINKMNHLELAVLSSLTKNQNMIQDTTLMCLNIINAELCGKTRNTTDNCNSFMASQNTMLR